MAFRPTISMLTLAAAVGWGVAPAWGDPSAAKKAEEFNYYWAFDAAPTVAGNPLGFDLYHNTTGATGGDGSADFLLNAGAAPTWSGGVLTLPNGANVFSQLWPVASGLNATSGYSVEYRVRASATSGLGLAMYESPDGTSAVGGISLLNDGDRTDVYYGMDTARQPARLRAAVPASQFVNLRVAAEYAPAQPGNLRYTLYVNGLRAGTDMNPSRSIPVDRLVFGDLGSSHAGVLELDSVGFTPGAYSPGRTYHPSLTPFSFQDSNDAQVRPSDGALMTVRTVAPDNIAFRVSHNNGQTWQTVGIVDNTATSVGQVAPDLIRQIDASRYVIVYRDRENFSPGWDHTNHHALASGDDDVWSIRSDDGGVTWKDRQRLLDGYSGSLIDAVVTRSGKVVVPVQNLDPALDRLTTTVRVSSDGGATWQLSNTLDVGGRGAESGAFEATLTERTDGSLFMLLRTSRGEFYRTTSNDEGLSWTDPVPSGIDASNSPGFLITLAGGDLALLWNRLTPEYEDSWERYERDDEDYAEQPSSYFREEVSLAFSSDGGDTWTDPLVVAANPGGTNLQYMRMFERQPGELWMRIGGQWLSMSVPVPEPSAAGCVLGALLLLRRRNRTRRSDR